MAFYLLYKNTISVRLSKAQKSSAGLAGMEERAIRFTSRQTTISPHPFLIAPDLFGCALIADR
jgi:hypothetical protein